jgi:P63C domain
MADDKNIIEPITATVDQVTTVIFAGTRQPKRGIKSTHEGILPLANVDLNVAVLDDGTRVISQAGVFKAFGRTKRGRGKNDIRVLNRPAFLDAKNLQPYINQGLEGVLNTITYTSKTGAAVEGYNAEILPKICEVYLDARASGDLAKQQEPLARASEVLLLALANVGITALVDEATGYQYDRKHDALRILLSKYIEEGLQKWIHTFPDTFFAELDRLYGNPTTSSRNRPQYYGRFINKYVYDPIENGYVKAELDKLNITDEGKRKARFHQWLTDEGRTILTRQIGRVEGIMEMCKDIEHFKQVARKQKTITVAPYLFDDMNRIID